MAADDSGQECPSAQAAKRSRAAQTLITAADPSARSQAGYGNLHPSFQEFYQVYLGHFGATASIDQGYVDDAGLAAYAAAIERQFGLICDLAGVPGHLFPEGYDRT
jgi:hypothetical protein